MAGVEKGGDGALGEGGAFQVYGLFDNGEAGDEVFGNDHPTEAHGWGNNLGEGADVKDPLVVVGAEGAFGFAVVGEEAVSVIFDDGQVVTAGQFDKLLAARPAYADAEGVVGFGNGVEEGGFGPGRQPFFDGGYVYAFVEVGGDGEDIGLEGGEDLLDAGVDGFFEHDLAAGIEEEASQYVEGLLSAGGDKDLFLGAGDTAPGHELDDVTFEGGRGRPVLEGERVGGEDVGGRLGQFFGRK